MEGISFSTLAANAARLLKLLLSSVWVLAAPAVLDQPRLMTNLFRSAGAAEGAAPRVCKACSLDSSSVASPLDFDP